jgi:hypothetical protein
MRHCSCYRTTNIVKPGDEEKQPSPTDTVTTMSQIPVAPVQPLERNFSSASTLTRSSTGGGGTPQHSLDQRWFAIAAKHAGDGKSNSRKIPRDKLQPSFDDDDDEDLELEAEIAAFREQGDSKNPRPSFTSLIEASAVPQSNVSRLDPLRAGANSFSVATGSTYGRLLSGSDAPTLNNSDSSSADGGASQNSS